MSRPIAERPTNYGAVGATAEENFLRFPPSGFEVVERRSRIGHGRARYEAAVAALRTWKIQRLAGIEVDVVGEGEGAAYRPVGFDDGVPTRASNTEGQSTFGPDGEPFLRPGDSVDQRIRIAGITIHAPMRVIAVEDEVARHSVVIGSLAGHPLAGEERFTVEIVDDESVFLHFRAMVRNEAWWARLAAPVSHAFRRDRHERFMDVLRSIDV